jgi:hypothetical protein
MKKILSVLVVSATLSGCAATAKLASLVPSFWDDNQSARIIDVRQRIAQIDCSQPQLAQARAVSGDLQWFELYSQSKGTRQQDVLDIIKPMQETVEDWVKRSQTREGSPAYCSAKKQILQGQSKRAAESILGRF